MDKKFLTVNDLRELLGIGRNQVYTLVSRADFPSVRIGQRILIPADLLDQWVNEQARKAV